MSLAYLLAAPSDDGHHPSLPRRVDGEGEGVPCDPLPAGDAALVARIRAGDRAAFGELYVTRYAELLRSAVRATGVRDAGDEIVQDVFLSIWMRRTELVLRTSMRAYLHGAVRFRAASFVRNDIARRDAEHADADFPELATSEPWPDDGAVTREQQTALLAAIRALPLRQREALILWSRHQMGLAELGEALGVSHVAARKLLRKAQDKLRTVLGEAENE